jgi:CHAT domain-containing protein
VQYAVAQHPLYQELEWLDSVVLDGTPQNGVPSLLECLSPNEALLDYALLGSDLYVFVVRLGADGRLAFSFAYLNGKADTIIADAVKTWRSSLSGLMDEQSKKSENQSEVSKAERVFQEQFDSHSRFLYEMLIAPIQPSLEGVDNLIIGPDGALSLLSFECLQDQEEYLLTISYNIRYVPTPRDLVRLRYAASQAIGSRNAELFGHGFAAPPEVLPQEPATKPNVPRAVYASFDVRSLEYVEDEIYDIRESLNNKKVPNQIHLNPDFTAEKLKAVTHPMVLHISTHGAFLPDVSEIAGNGATHPLERVLLLTEGAQYKGAWLEAGKHFVTARDVLGMDLRQTVVVLSACDTSVADAVGAGGMTSLMQAFLLAGARTVIATLWSVFDASSAELMSRFYQYLLTGADTQEALRLVRQEFFGDGETKHPMYWGVFQHYGQASILEIGR